MNTQGAMKFLNWRDGTSRFSMTIEGANDVWLFVDNGPKGSLLLNGMGETIAESVDRRPAWRRWLSLLGPVEFQKPDGTILCRLERKGWGSQLRYTIGPISQVLFVEMQFTQTFFKSKSLRITMGESNDNTASFECVPSFDPIPVMLITAQIVAYHHRI